jgi:hypothetical protein
MTGVDINKIRHYAPGFNNRTTRLDADMSALLFKAGTRIISSSERLIADVSIKAAMGAGAPAEDKKRGLQSAGKSKYININGLVYDPEAKKQEGQFFKPWVTERERINAMRSNDPVPNWGWVDRNPENQNRLQEPKNAKGKVTRYPVNPKTGEPMKNYGVEQEFKSLGPTLAERNPGGKLLARTAKSFGVVVDALGKFRCPPGTPAANRFTNFRGEGCFDISVAQVRNLIGSLTQSMQAPQSGSQTISSLTSAGVSIAEIRKSFKENGIAGLASLAKRVGIAHVGDKWNDMSYVSQIAVRLREVSGLTMGAQSRMEKIAQKKADTINFLAEYYGITEPNEYKKIAQIIEKMSADSDSPLDPNQFKLLFRGGSLESHEEWAVEAIIKTHIEAIGSKLGIDATDALEAYEEAKRNGEITPLTRFVDAALERERDFRLGAFEDMLVAAYEQPHTFTLPGGKKRIYTAGPIPDGPDGEKYNVPRWDRYDLNGYAEPEFILINSGPAILGFRGGVPPSEYMDLYEATGGDIDDQWRAVASEMDKDERLRAYSALWSVDLAATEGRGWRDFGAQTSAHERAHWGQMDAIFQYHAETNPDVAMNDLNNKELMELTNDFLTKATPEILRDVFGADIEDLIDKRFDALAGAYSQKAQQEALEELTGGGSKEDFNYSRSIALLETLSELKANKSVGLIGDDPELDAILDKMTPLPPMTAGAISPSGGIVPSPPGGSPRPVRPSLPSSAPALVPNAGKVVTVIPGRGSGRGGRGPVDPFERSRHGKIPRMIEDGTLSTADIDEFIYGKDGKEGGLIRIFKNVKNMKIEKDGRREYTLVERKRILNELVDTMGVSIEELEKMALKARNGEPLTSEEKEKLVNAITHLRNGGNEFKRKLEEAQADFDNYQGVDTEFDFSDQDANYVALEQLQKQVEMYEALYNRVGRTLAPAIHDILTISENGPYPPGMTLPRRGYEPIMGIDVDSADSIASRQSSRLNPQELAALSSAVTNPPRIISSSNPQNIFELTSTLEDIENVRQVFERNNLTPPTTVADDELKNAAPVMSGLDKSIIPEDMVVELEIDMPEDTSPGSIHEIPQISSAQLITDSNTEEVDIPSSGFSSTTGARTRAGIAGRLIASQRTRKLLEKAGIDAERTDVVQLMSEVAIGFSIGGPYGALLPIARRGSRDAAEQALRMMVERGWIEQDIANKIEKYGLDRIAAEGLPDEILNLAESAKGKLLTDDSKRKALEFGSVLQDRSIELSDVAREKASAMAASGKEKARELTGAGRETARRLRNRLGGGSEEIDATDAFSLPPSGSPFDIPAPDIYPFKSAFVDIEFKQLGTSLMEQKQGKKTKVRIAVPAGSKGKIEAGKTKASNMILPPGKVKFTGVGEDGVPEAEIFDQMSAEQYMKNVEKISLEVSSSSNKPSIKKSAKLRADTAKKMRQEMVAKSGTPQSMSGISKIVFDKSNSIMERGEAAGINFFTLEKIKNNDTDIDASEYVRLYQEKLISTINNYSKSLPTRLFDDGISADTKKFIYGTPIKEVVKAVNEVAVLIHNDIDRRARVSMSKSSLEQFVGSGKIANIDVDSESLKILKTKRDAMLGNAPGIKEFSFTPIELIHGILIEKVEENLYKNGTHVGSEEFTDYGRGIELVLRAENSPRIGYGRKESYKNGGIFVQINEEDEQIIQAAIFGQMFMSTSGAEEYLAEIIEASLSKDYSKLIKKNDEDIFEAFIVGEISLNDVEHIKIPLSIFNIRKKRVSKSSMIGGADSINMIFMNRGVPKEKIKDFFDGEGTIGGGYTPKHLSYLNELEAAEEFKENLISLGIDEVLFTNKDGIDIMSEDTWRTPPPTKKKGKDALREIARREVMSIIDKIAPALKKAEPKKETVKK